MFSIVTRVGAVVCAMTAAVVAHGQLMIQQVTLQGGAIAPSTFFQAMVLNSGGAQVVRFDGGLRSKAGEQVISFSARPFTLKTGVSPINAAMLELTSMTYGQGTAGRMIKLTNRLPEGDYTFCLRVTSMEGEGEDEVCEAYRMEELLFLDLVSPWNGDTLDELRPTLSWLLTGSPMAITVGKARITVVPQPKGMSAAQAISSQVPLFIHPPTSSRSLAHPPGLPDLMPGKCYAWQAVRVVEGRVVDRSDPWTFCVRQRNEPMADKYIRLDRLTPGTVYKAVDRRLFFRYDEPYAAQALDCEVISSRGQRVKPLVDKEGAGVVHATSAAPGANLFELDLSSYGLKPGIHTLLVRDAKGRRYEFQFESKY